MQRLILLNIDPPQHTKLRGIVSRGFTPRAIGNLREALTDRAEAIVQDALYRRLGRLRQRRGLRTAAAGHRRTARHTAGRPAQDLRLVERDDRLRRPGVRRRPAGRRGRTGRLQHGHGRGPPRLPAGRHRHQAGARRGGRRPPVAGRVRLLHDPALGGRQRDHPERDLPRHAGVPGPPRAVGAVQGPAAGERGGRDRPLGHPGDRVPAHRAGRHGAGRPADQRRASGSACSTGRPTSTRTSSTTRSGSTSCAARTRTWASVAPVRTTASGSTWPGWRSS